MRLPPAASHREHGEGDEHGDGNAHESEGSCVVKSAPLRNPKQESQRLLGSWPQLSEERFAAASDEVPKN